MTPKINPSGGKSNVLAALATHLRNACIPRSLVIAWDDWTSSSQASLNQARTFGAGFPVVVRSDRRDEDELPINAGRYLTLLNVLPTSDELREAIDRVFASFGSDRKGDKVLIQPLVPEIKQALVASTFGAFGCAYDTISLAAGAAPDAITRGDSPANTWHVRPGTDYRRLPALISRTWRLLQELKALVAPIPFEIELVDDGNVLWLLQLRPLPGDLSPSRNGDSLDKAIGEIRRSKRQGARLFGLMPDWNTAELLGAHPRPMALSLFEGLIGDSVWWRARAQLGYAQPYRNQLIRPIAGRPYVDVRASFESLCPAELPERQRTRMVRAWLDQLQSRPELHDRVELDVVFSGYEFDLGSRIATAGCRSLSSVLVPSLKRLTVTSLCGEEMESEMRMFYALVSTPSRPGQTLLERWNLLRETVALPFARMARRDFLSRGLWQSLIRLGAIEAGRYLDMLSSNHEGSELFESGAVRAARPSQFDIRSATLEPLPMAGQTKHSREPFHLTTRESSDLIRLLREHGLPWNPEQLVTLSRIAARGRELGKWALAALLGDWMNSLRQLGADKHLDTDVLSWLPWPAIVNSTQADIGRLIEQSISASNQYHRDSQLKMPLIFAGSSELHVVNIPPAGGHYLGRGAVEGPLVCLTAESARNTLPPNAIVAIRSADPGFEWIFSYQPAALITAFGGPHSHMALRCADAGCGAVLGIGPERFDRLAGTSRVFIDFEQASVEARSDRERRRALRVA